jgi:hypothetical protein
MTTLQLWGYGLTNIFAQTGLNHDPLISASCIAGVTDVNRLTWLVLWDIVSLAFFTQAGLNCDPPIHLPGITGMNQCVQPISSFWRL